MDGVAEVVHHPVHVAAVRLDGRLTCGLASQSLLGQLPVAVECQAHKLAIGIHRRRAGIATDDVQVGQEIDRKRTQFW